MTFRTRLVLATTVAVVVAVLVASTASFLAARNSLLGAADNSLTAAAKKITAGQQISTTTATLGQVIDSAGALVSGGAPPDHPPGRGWWPPGWPRPSSPPSTWGRPAARAGRTPARRDPARDRRSSPRAGPCRSPPCSTCSSELDRLGIVLGAVALIGVLLAVVLGWLVAQTALVPLNALTDTVEDLAETTDVTRRLSPGGPDELGRLRRTFNRLLEALEFSRRAQSQLVVDASHELRTPLTSLRTNLEVIRRVDELSEADRSVLVDDVLVQLQELTDLVGDLAELARGDQLPVRQEPLRLDLLVRDAVAVATTHGRTQGVTFDLVSEECWVGRGRRPPLARRGQPARQRPQVEPPGTGRSPCSAATARSWCATAGPASRPTDLPHVFDRFYRAPSARGLPGSGPRAGHRGPGGQGRGGHHRGRGRSRRGHTA